MTIARGEIQQLEDNGGLLHYFLQACLFLYKHPDAIAGEPLPWSDTQALITSLLTGAIIDVIARYSGGHASIIKAERNGATATIRIDLSSLINGDGFDVLRRLATSVEIEQRGDRAELTVSVTGVHLRSCFGGP